jgi:hypothetical protein
MVTYSASIYPVYYWQLSIRILDDLSRYINIQKQAVFCDFGE